MDVQELFEQRNMTANKLKEVIRDLGYTKISLSQKSGIGKETIDHLLSANINDKILFEKSILRILEILNLTVDEMMNYQIRHPKTNTAPHFLPFDHQISEKASKQYDLLLDIVDLCVLYY